MPCYSFDNLHNMSYAGGVDGQNSPIRNVKPATERVFAFPLPVRWPISG
jgi:hypothetical protein